MTRAFVCECVMSHSTPFPSESPSGPVDHDFGPGAAVERPLRHSVLMVRAIDDPVAALTSQSRHTCSLLLGRCDRIGQNGSLRCLLGAPAPSLFPRRSATCSIRAWAVSSRTSSSSPRL